MKYLSEIARIVTNFREENIEIIDENTALSSEDAISKLYAGLKNRSIDSDQKAAEVLYGKPILDTKYTSMKNRLKKRLLNSLFFLNIRPPTFSEYATSLYQSNKNLFLVKTLSNLGARNTAIKIAENALSHAKKYNLTANAIEFLSILRNYSSIYGDEKAYDDYSELLRNKMKTYEAEILAQEYNDRVTIKFAKSSAEQPEMKDIIETYCSELALLREKYDSITLNYNYFRLQTISYQISQNYENAIKICNEAENYLVSNPHLSYRIRLGEFAIQRLSCYLNIKDYENGKKAASRCGELFPSGTDNNWFVYMELYFYLAMHTARFGEAEIIYNEVTTHTRFTFQPEHKKENWKLLELYMRFALGASNSLTEKKSEGPFDLKKFLRAVPSYKADKRGYNVAILILHILYLLENNEFGEIVGRMDALRSYRTRYLRAGSNKQSALFFRMLQIMETNNFSYELTKEKSQKYFDKMQSISAEFTEIQDGLQVLPFDWMWNKILEMLKQKEDQKIITKVEKGKSELRGREQIHGYAVPSGRAGAHD